MAYSPTYSTGDLKSIFVDVVGVVAVAVKDNASDIVSMIIVGIIVSIAAVLLAQVFGIIDLTKFIKWGQ
jgi:uncharacterized membrane protein